MNKRTKISLVVILIVMILSIMACINPPCILGDACEGAVWEVVTQTAQSAELTATYGAEQLHLQLTEIAK